MFDESLNLSPREALVPWFTKRVGCLSSLFDQQRNVKTACHKIFVAPDQDRMSCRDSSTSLTHDGFALTSAPISSLFANVAFPPNQFHNFKTLIIIKREARMVCTSARSAATAAENKTRNLFKLSCYRIRNLSSSRAHYLLKTFVNRWHMTQWRLTRNLSSELLVAFCLGAKRFHSWVRATTILDQTRKPRFGLLRVARFGIWNSHPKAEQAPKKR